MTTSCAKCGAELIGSRKFCTACGTPVADPRALGGPVSGGAAPVSVVAGADGGAGVNPFAVTAPPNTMSPAGAPARSSNYGPPPGQAIVTPATPIAVPPELRAQVALSETETDPNALPMLPATPSPDGRVPSAGAVASGSPLSPLAVSSLMPSAEDQEAAEAARARVRLAEAAQANKAPGTQIMPSIPRPGQAGPVSAGAPSVGAQGTPSKRQDRTQLLAAMPPGVPRPPTPLPGAASTAPVRPGPPSTSKMAAAPVAAGSSPSVPGSLPSDGRGSNPPPQAYGQPPRSAGQPGQPAPPSHVAPSGVAGHGMYPAQPAGAYKPPSHGNAPPPSSWSQAQQQPAGYGWSQPQPSQAQPPQHAPPQPPHPAQPPPSAYGAPPAYGAGGYGGFGYQPGARVVVTWSTGQRFPATVQQVGASQCLVVFPDGQQHWVDMQYVAPA